METITAQLCRCNNCMSIMIDLNPYNQPELTINTNELIEMGHHKGEHYPECPVCKTDGYLIDIISVEMLEDTLITRK